LALFILGPVIAFGCASTQLRAASSPEAFVVGSVHRYHLDASSRYSLTDLDVQLTQMRPDLLCGEITPEHLGTQWEGYYPPEVALVQDVAARLGIPFVAADWRGDSEEARKAEESMAPEAKKRYSTAHEPLLARWKERREESLFDFIHGEEAQRLIRQAHDVRLASGGEAADGFWLTRNRRIVERCMAEASWRHSRRIVFVFGGEHKYAIEDELWKQHGLRAAEVRRQFVPATNELSEAVISRWKDRRTALARLADTGSNAEVREKVLGSHRLEELDLFIESKGKACHRDDDKLVPSGPR
jgi:hypothetical protein